MQHTDKARAEFEAAYMRELVGDSSAGADMWLERGSDGEYRSYRARGAWWGWQASRASVVVELPQVVAFEGAYDSLRSHEYSDHAGELVDADEVFSLSRTIEVREAIEAAGLTVKE